MPKIRYLADASREIKEASAYYEAISPHLGQRFRLSVRDGVRRIAGHMHWWPKVGERARRYLLTGWPYSNSR